MFRRHLVRYWYLLIFAIFIIVTQIILLKPHLKYGFSDVDWGFLTIYKTQNPYTLTQFVDNFKEGNTKGGVYTHQIYYIGIQSEFFGLDFEKYQLTTHIFKILAIFASIPIFLAISGSLFVAFISTLIFAFSYSAVGTMYTTVTSSDYSAIFSAGLFVLLYWQIIKRNTANIFVISLSLLLLLITLFLSTERMYPVPFFILITEIFLLWTRKRMDKNTFKRISILLLPLFFIFLFQPFVFLSFVMEHGTEIIKGVSSGNMSILLTPLIALGSVLIPPSLIRYLGFTNINYLNSVFDFFLGGHTLVFIILAIIIGIIIFKSITSTLHILVLTQIMFTLIYILGISNSQYIISGQSTAYASFGGFILSIAATSFIKWLKTKDKTFVALFASPLLALLYIILTWLGASVGEVFAGIHRYLTVPALLMSLFLGNLFVIAFLRLWNLPKLYTACKVFSVIPVLFLYIFLNISAKEIQIFFQIQLSQGFGAEDKQMMRSQLLKYLDNLSSREPSLFYFDFSQDNDRGYYYDNTITGGFKTWLLWHENINLNEELKPEIFWNNMERLKKAYVASEGRGFIYHAPEDPVPDKFYSFDDFYAFKLKNKKVTNIKEEVLSQLRLTSSFNK